MSYGFDIIVTADTTDQTNAAYTMRNSCSADTLDISDITGNPGNPDKMEIKDGNAIIDIIGTTTKIHTVDTMNTLDTANKADMT